MRLFVSKRIPDFDRLLLIESGSRQLLENFLPVLYARYGEAMQLDILTCYAGAPATFRPEQGRVFRVTDYPASRSGRMQLIAELRRREPSITGIICSDEDILTKWKWLVAARVPAKLFIINENGDYFWVDRGNLRIIRHFMLFRLGLTGAGAVVTVARLVLMPFSFLYLLAFAGVVHLQRKVRA